jgi:aminoglycoside phosphotransferase family enzyme/predicted kinase
VITQDQTEIIEFLATPSTHGDGVVERIETHAAVVFLAGTRAYKLKRAVLFDYLDFSAPEQRRTMCEAELRLNRRTAPALYRRVVAVTRESDGSLALGGRGTAIDWVVEMNRFDQDALFDRLAAADRLDVGLMPPLAAAIAEFHAAAEPRHDHGGKAGMAWVIHGNSAGFAEYGTDCLDRSACARLADQALRELERRGALLNARRDAGLVRQCHGDLHLRNIVLLDGHPTLFDAVEFNDEIACTDVLYDLAFLLMDLWRRHLPRHANVVWNHYLGLTGALAGICLLPLFLSCRAAVRAKTGATAASVQNDAERRRELQEQAREYLAMAVDLLRPPNPCVIAIGGLSGSGKSTLALGLAPSVGPVPGALVHRSDEIRKRLCGASPIERLGPEGYSAEVTQQVYAALVEHARQTVQEGHSAIVDAVYARPEDRHAIERVAADASVPFLGFWLEAPESILLARSEQRQNDPSDANAEVIRLQLAQGAGSVRWPRLDASMPSERVLQNAVTCLRKQIVAP